MKDVLGQNYAAHFSKTPFALKGGISWVASLDFMSGFIGFKFFFFFFFFRNRIRFFSNPWVAGGLPGTTARLTAWFGALGKVVNKGEAPPSLVALLLQFLEAPDPPDPEPEEEVAKIYGAEKTGPKAPNEAMGAGCEAVVGPQTAPASPASPAKASDASELAEIEISLSE